MITSATVDVAEATATGRLRTARRRPAWLPLLLPALVLYALFFVGPVLFLAINSVTDTEGSDIFGPATLQHYARFVSDPFYLEVLWRSVVIATIVALCDLVLAYPVAWYVATRGGRSVRLVLFAMLTPLLAGGVVLSVGWLNLMVRGGSIQRLAELLPFVEQGPVLLRTPLGIVIGVVHFLLPFMILSLVSAFEQIPWNTIRAARSLGANGVSTFGRVLLPLSAPGIATGVSIVFALAMSAFAVPFFLGGSSNLLMSTLSYQQTARVHDYSFGAVLAIVLVAVSALVVVVVRAGSRMLNPVAVEGRRSMVQ